jgi:SEC-C motif-containing protein
VPIAQISITHCTCGNPRPYGDCCGRFHAGEAANTAQKLMRSRYSAYMLQLEDYLLATWHPLTRPVALSLAEADTTRWLGLDIRSQQETFNSARVEFIARYRVGGGPVQKLHEISRFVREDERWFYLDGEFPPPKASFAKTTFAALRED